MNKNKLMILNLLYKRYEYATKKGEDFDDIKLYSTFDLFCQECLSDRLEEIESEGIDVSEFNSIILEDYKGEIIELEKNNLIEEMKFKNGLSGFIITKYGKSKINGDDEPSPSSVVNITNINIAGNNNKLK